MERLPGAEGLAELVSRLHAFYRGVGSGGFDAAVEIFAEDAVLQGPGRPPLIGASAIRAWWRSVIDEFSFDVAVDVHEAEQLGPYAMLRGRAHGAMTPRNGGDPVVVDTWFQQVYRPDDTGVLRFWRGANGPNATPPH